MARTQLLVFYSTWKETFHSIFQVATVSRTVF